MLGSLRLSRLPRLALLRQARFRALVSSGHLHGCVGRLLRSRLSCCGLLFSSLILRLRDASAEASSRRDIPDCAWGDRSIRFAHHDDPRSSWRERFASDFAGCPRLGPRNSALFRFSPRVFVDLGKCIQRGLHASLCPWITREIGCETPPALAPAAREGLGVGALREEGARRPQAFGIARHEGAGHLSGQIHGHAHCLGGVGCGFL